MLVTICFIHQLPQVLVLADSYRQQSPAANSETPPIVIGLADDPANLPAGFQSPYPLLPVSTLFEADYLQKLSAQYTPVEFAAACKPRFIQAVFTQYPTAQTVLYADPNGLFLHSVQPILDRLLDQTVLLTPHMLYPPGDTGPGKSAWPDEKYLQNIGLYSADFLAFARSSETDRLLSWWQDRVEERAYIDFCQGLCTDQLWLMHVPVFFDKVTIVHNPGWHVALWNLPRRQLRQSGTDWQLTDTGEPVLFANMKGLFNPDEGFFPHQTRLKLADRPDVQALLNTYRQRVSDTGLSALRSVSPAYGHQPIPAVLRGWRRAATGALTAVNRWVDNLDLPALPR
ncbi:hypothetical protein [Spirosoma rhododendri]|uniref:Glycosyl transferase n=1 Tax=Spirosoma rhododendri TaxID=2728024 RepID=A0A7L5DKT9_9BACT|nr:hypothetical protein [Spirosoma rhododendri]QJD79046.1 hypothetical protein HH216_11890 [Spirosoma rhododendri]